MAEKPDRESKTEQPTEKRVRDSADEGNVAFSREIPTSAAIIVFSAYFAYYGRACIYSVFDSNKRDAALFQIVKHCNYLGQ